MDNTNNILNKNSDGINVYSFSQMDNTNNNNDLQLLKTQEEKIKFNAYLQNYRVMKIMFAGFWDESNGIFCDECGAQVNFWENPYGDLVVESYSVYNDLQEEQFNELSEEDKLLYKKCLDCFSYKKITSGKKEFSDCCKIRNTFKFSNGSILKEN